MDQDQDRDIARQELFAAEQQLCGINAALREGRPIPWVQPQPDEMLAVALQALEEHKTELAEARIKAAGLTQEVARLSHLLAAVQEAGAVWEKRWDSLQQHAAALNQQISQRDQKIAELERALESGEQKRWTAAAEAEQRVRDLQGLLDRSQQRIQTLSRQEEMSQARIAELMRLMDTKTLNRKESEDSVRRECEMLRIRLGTAQAAIAELNGQLEAARTESSVATAVMQKEGELLASRLGETQAVLADMTRQLETVRTEAAAAQAAAEKETNILKARLADLGKSLAERTAELSMQAAAAESAAGQENEILKARLADLGESLKKRDAELSIQAAAAAKLVALQAQLDDERSNSAAETAALKARMRERLLADALKIDTIKNQLREAQARISTLSTQSAAPSVSEPHGPTATEADVPPMPGLAAAGALDTGWSKALDFMRQSLALAYAHLRKLSASSLTDPQRIRLKLAAGALTQGTDATTALGEFLDEAGAPAVPGRLEAAVTSALSVWEPTLRRQGIRVSRSLDTNMPPVIFHPEALRLAFYQVLRNAYESMPQGGSLTVRLCKDPRTATVCVAFADTGTGFTPEALERLPEPFSSSKPGHMGLGLALTHRILGRWGATLEAVNNARIGATVTLRFAAGQGETPPLQSDPPA
ncbi:MAG TPA: hypothetical protein DEB40_03960 [Elusimicrobia bacterium]|nr:hypothetical protein [Elusimicrobiota bacterium]HBT60882.1 hypothetical protein [Elusimicrobiota bacterium]